MTVHAGEGTILKVDVSATLTAVAQVISIDGPDSSVPEVETTHLGSSAKAYRPGEIPEAGSLDFSIYFDPSDTGHQELQTLAKTPSTVSWQVTFSDGSTLDWEGFLTSFSLSGMEDESNLTADCSVRITGQITFTEVV
ncbi:MAG: phage tail tube protein [Planctomycetaceae bacterium]